MTGFARSTAVALLVLATCAPSMAGFWLVRPSGNPEPDASFSMAMSQDFAVKVALGVICKDKRLKLAATPAPKDNREEITIHYRVGDEDWTTQTWKNEKSRITIEGDPAKSLLKIIHAYEAIWFKIEDGPKALITNGNWDESVGKVVANCGVTL